MTSKVAHRPERDRAIFSVLRAMRDRSPKDIAAKAGVSPQTIAKWKRPVAQGGTRYPQFWTLNRVANACGMEFRLCDKRESAHNSRAKDATLVAAE